MILSELDPRISSSRFLKGQAPLAALIDRISTHACNVLPYLPMVQSQPNLPHQPTA